MPIPVHCPGCNTRLNAPDAAAGKNVKCPKCQVLMTIPGKPQAAAEYEVVDDAPPPPKKAPSPPKSKPAVVKAAVVVDDDEDEKPRKKKRRDEDAGDDEKPRKKKRRDDDDDDDEDRERKKRKKAAAASASMTRNIVGIVALLIAGGVAAFVWMNRPKEETVEAKGNVGDDQRPNPGPGPGPGPNIGPGPGPNIGPGPTIEPGPGQGPETKTGGASLNSMRVGGPVFSTDGKWILARTLFPNRTTVGVWDAQTGAFYASFGGRNEERAGLSGDRFDISPDAKQAADVSVMGETITFWELPSGRLIKSVKLSPKDNKTRLPPFLRYAADGKSVLTVFEKSLVRVNTENWQEEVLLTDLNTANVVYCPAKNLIAECRYVSNGATDSEVRIFDLNTKSPPKTFPGPNGASFAHSPKLGISADGSILIVATDDANSRNLPFTFVVYDTSTGQSKGTVVVSKAMGISYSEVHLSPDGRRALMIGSVREGDMRVRYMIVADTSGKELKRIGLDAGDSPQSTGFSSDGKSIAYTLAKGVKVYDVETGTERTP